MKKSKILLAIEIVELAKGVFEWVLKKTDSRKTHVIAKSSKTYTRKHSAQKGAERFAESIKRKVEIV